MKRLSLAIALLLASLVSPLTSAAEPVAEAKQNELTEQQQKEGWKLLFDGKSLDQWRGYKSKDLPASWEVRDGAIFCNDKAGADLLTRDTFGDFELSLEWKISAGGNSGVHLRSTETTPDLASNALEIQVIDTSEGWKKVHGYALGSGQEAGALYDLFPAKKESIREGGQWNHLYVKMVGSKLRIEQNKVVIVDTDMSSDDWNKRLARSKFGKSAHFNKVNEGAIGLQNYRGAGVWYRNVMIKTIKAEAEK